MSTLLKQNCQEKLQVPRVMLLLTSFYFQRDDQEGGYSPKKVFNVDRTCLYWKSMMEISREGKSNVRIKIAKG